MNYAEHALSILKHNGLRITNARKLVLETLENSSFALSPYEIQGKLKDQGQEVDVSSVYRIVECLEQFNLVHKVLPSGKIFRCKMDCEEDGLEHHKGHHHDHDHHHHHDGDGCMTSHHSLVCRNCGNIQEINCTGVDVDAQNIAQRWGFQTESHQLQLSGLCKQCQ